MLYEWSLACPHPMSFSYSTGTTFHYFPLLKSHTHSGDKHFVYFSSSTFTPSSNISLFQRHGYRRKAESVVFFFLFLFFLSPIVPFNLSKCFRLEHLKRVEDEIAGIRLHETCINLTISFFLYKIRVKVSRIYRKTLRNC